MDNLNLEIKSGKELSNDELNIINKHRQKEFNSESLLDLKSGKIFTTRHLTNYLSNVYIYALK